MTVEITREFTGHFIATRDGAPSKYEIINGSLGSTGRGFNMYGIKNTETGAIRWIGTLQACKKLVRHWLR